MALELPDDVGGGGSGSGGSSTGCNGSTCWAVCWSATSYECSGCGKSCSGQNSGGDCQCGHDCAGCGGCDTSCGDECDTGCSTGCKGNCGSGCSAGCTGGCQGSCDQYCLSTEGNELYIKLTEGLNKKILAYDLNNINRMIELQAARRGATISSQTFSQRDKATSQKIESLQSNLGTIGHPTTLSVNQKDRTLLTVGNELINKAIEAYGQLIPHS